MHTSPGAGSPRSAAVRVVVGGEALTLPARRVRSISRVPRLTRVPHAPPAMAGLANIEGAVLPVIRLTELLGRPDTDPARLVVFEGAVPCGLLVDEVRTVAIEDGQSDRSREIDERLTEMRSVTPARVRPAVRSAPAPEQAQADELSFVTFWIGRQEFAFPIEQVSEVIRPSSALALLPGGDAVSRGTLAHRGRLLPVLSLAALLNIPGGDAGGRERVVVVTIGGYRVALAVDAVDGVLRLPADRLDPISPILRRSSQEARIQAIGRLDDGRRLVSVLSAGHLLNEELMARLRGNDEGHSVAVDENKGATEQLLAFRIGDEEFALPVDAVEEIVRVPEKLTRLPAAPAFVEGLMNLRGQVIPVIDQSRRFQDRAATATTRRIIVANAADLRAGFVVDAVTEVLRVPADLIGPTPELSGHQVRLFERVAALDGGNRIVLIVSPKELLDRAERDMLAQMLKRAALQDL